MKRDINNRKDIELLISKFYNALLEDENINHFFEDILIKDSLKEHLKIVVDFWDDILLGSSNYGKNAMKPHIELNKKKKFENEHFNIWLNHFNTTIDYYFKGDKVELAKTRALSIATIMQIKMKTSQN